MKKTLKEYNFYVNVNLPKGTQIREYFAPDKSCAFLSAKLPIKGWTQISKIKELKEKKE